MNVWIVVKGEAIGDEITYGEVLGVYTDPHRAYRKLDEAWALEHEDSTEEIMVSGPHEVME